MHRIAHLRPPPEIQQLGSVEYVFQSQPASAKVMWSTLLLGTLFLVAAVVLAYVKFGTDVLPRKPAYWNYGVYSLIAIWALLGLFLFMRYWWLKVQPPMYVYAFYPQGLAVRHGNKWGLIPWKRIVAFDQFLIEPMLILDNARKIPVKHNFVNPAELYEKINQYVFEKERQQSGIFESPPTTDFFVPAPSSSWKLIIGAVLFSAAILLGAFNWEIIQPVGHDFRKLTEDEVMALKEAIPTEPQYAIIKNLRAIKTDATFSRLRYYFSRNESKLVLLPIKESYLIANVRPDFDSDVEIKGKLSVWTEESDYYARKRYEAMKQVMEQFPEYKEMLLPFQMDSIVVGDDVSLVWRIVLGTMAVIGLLLLLTGMSRNQQKPSKVIVD